MLKVLFFDFYGTLAGFNPSRYEIQSKACDELGFNITEEGILKGYKFADILMTEQNKKKPVSNLNKNESLFFFAQYEKLVLSGCDIDVDLYTARDIWLEVKKIPYDLELYDDAIPALQIINANNIDNLIISNMNQSGLELIDNFNLNEHVKFAVTSMELGVMKPDPAIFQRALDVSGCSETEVIHVGDQVGSDVEGAENSGIKPILMDRDNNYPGFDRCERVSNLYELVDLLDLE